MTDADHKTLAALRATAVELRAERAIAVGAGDSGRVSNIETRLVALAARQQDAVGRRDPG